MANEIDDLKNQVDQLNRQVKGWGDSLNRNSNTSTIYNNSLRESADASKDAAEAEKKLSGAISGTMSGLTGFAKSLANGSGSFAPLTAAISLSFKVIGKVVGGFPLVGKALKGLAEGASEVASHMVESFDKAYSTFEKISDSGVVSSFTEMKHTARALQLNYSQTEAVLTKNSQNLALFAGSALKGRQEFERMAFDSYDLRRQFQKLGISGEEFSEMQLSYLNQQMRMGQGQKKTTEQLIAGSIEYIKELDVLSKVTGISKKELQSGREARMSDPRFRASMAGVPGKIVDNIHTFLDLSAKESSKELATGMQEYLSSGPSGPLAAEMINSFGPAANEAMKILDSVNRGELEASEARKQLTPLHIRAKEATNRLAATYGDQLTQTKYFMGHANAELLAGKDQQKLMEEEQARQAKILADQTSENKKLADTKLALEQAGRDIEQMSTSGTLVTGLMNIMAEGLETVTEKLYELAKEDLPEHLKAKKEERKAIKEEKEARLALAEAEKAGFTASMYGEEAGLGGDPVFYAQSKLDEKTKKLIAAKTKTEEAYKKAGISAPGSRGRTSTTGAGGFLGEYGDLAPPGAGEVPVSTSTAPGGARQLSSIRSKSGPSAQVSSQYAKNFQGLIDWFDSQGYKIKSLGGYADRNIAGTNTPSYHSKGEAIDINPAENPMGSQRITDMPQGTRQAAKSMGLGWGLDWQNKSDAMHFSAGRGELGTLSARTGGIFSGPESGYLAELHGTESVVSTEPVDDGDSGAITKRSLGSGSMMAGSTNKISEIYSNLVEKMDTLIDLMDTSMENQKEFLQARSN